MRPSILPRWTTSAAFLHGDDPSRHLGVVMQWFVLVVAGIFEIGWAVGLKYTQGFSRPWPTVATVATVAAMVISLLLLGIAMKSLPLGTAYAIWVGVGVVGTALLGIFLFAESASAVKIVSIVLIVAGIIGLKLAGDS
jgi:quaternary ammonium compound-resistance protein SugE